MEIVVGLSLKNLKPRCWRPSSPYYLPEVEAVMVSYAEFDAMAAPRRKAMEHSLRGYLDVPDGVAIYLDNGSFSFRRKGRDVPKDAYLEFVKEAQPDWYAVPQDFIPSPAMSDEEQRHCVVQTMAMNRTYSYDGFVPVMHVSRLLDRYVDQFQQDEKLADKERIAIGGIVPNLLRAPKAMAYEDVLDGLHRVRQIFQDKEIHLFGVGGTATLHLAALLGIDSVDSTGWRNRGARGIVQLPGRGDRTVANLGNWRGREPDDHEWDVLADCTCPACQQHGIEGLQASRSFGFHNRATHNLWVLLEEARQIDAHLNAGSYIEWYEDHVRNSIYKPLIDYLVEERG